jgi:hypothetical protein
MPTKPSDEARSAPRREGSDRCATVSDFAPRTDIGAYNEGVALADAIGREFGDELRKVRTGPKRS